MKTATKISLFISLMMFQKQSRAQGIDTSRFVMQVVFVQFDAASSDEGITLKWTTILETNLATYVIERSNGSEDFKVIDKITAKGSSNISVPYSYTDKNPLKGINVYRLKMVDTKGGFKYSGYKQFVWTKSLTHSGGIKAYPNPSAPGNTIQIDVAFKGTINIQLLTLNGERISMLNQNIGAHGALTYQLPSKAKKGMYILILTNSANESYQTKVMIM